MNMSVMGSLLRSRRFWLVLGTFLLAELVFVKFVHFGSPSKTEKEGMLPHPVTRDLPGMVVTNSREKISDSATSQFAKPPASITRPSHNLGKPPSPEELKAYGSYYERVGKEDGGSLRKKFQCQFSLDNTWPATPDKPEPVAILSMLSATVPSLLKDYVVGLEVLGYSLFEHCPSNVHRIVMLLEGSPCEKTCQDRLHDAGWKICTAPKVVPPHPSDFPRFRDQFVKLVLWNMVQYKTIVYMDADTLAVGSLDRLLGTEVGLSKKRPMAVAQDISAAKWVNGFNMGVAVIPTNGTEFVRLHRLMAGDKVKYRQDMSEQGFLNAVYGNAWVRLKFEDNANLAAWIWDKKQWKAKASDICVVHYTMEKGWQIKGRSAYLEIGKYWWDRRASVCAERCSQVARCAIAQALGCDCKAVANSVCMPK